MAAHLFGCFPITYKYQDSTDSGHQRIEDLLDDLIERSATRQEVVDSIFDATRKKMTKYNAHEDLPKFGFPFRYRESTISYKACTDAEGVGIFFFGYITGGVAPIKEWEGECFEVILKFSNSDQLIGYDEKPIGKSASYCKINEERTYRALGEQGDEVALGLWRKTDTFRAQEQKKLAEEGGPIDQMQFYLFGNTNVEGTKFLCRAADQGYVPAMLEVAKLYWRGGADITPDLRRAYVWYSLSADKTHSKAYQWELSELEAAMTPEQLLEAEKIYIAWKPSQCEHNLTSSEDRDPEMLMQTYFLNPTSIHGLTSLCQAADEGHAGAQSEIARLYSQGDCPVSQDAVRAHMWYSLAVEAGHEEYKWKLDEIAGTLSPERLAEAEEMLIKWQPSQCQRELIHRNFGN